MSLVINTDGAITDSPKGQSKSLISETEHAAAAASILMLQPILPGNFLHIISEGRFWNFYLAVIF